MPNLFARLRTWRAIAATPPLADDPEVEGGRLGEQVLDRLVGANAQFKGAGLYPNKRVPAGHRRREIDLIVVTPRRIHVIEIKNWSGSLRAVGDRWIQTNRSGREIPHPNLVADNQDKNLALLDYLAHQGVPLDANDQRKYLSNKVIFINPRLTVADPVITQHPEVLLAPQLDTYLNQQKRNTLGQRLLGSVAQWCLDSETADGLLDRFLGSLTSARVAAIRDAIDRLPTWDALHYFGGRIETGDLLRLSIDGQTLPRASLGAPASCPVRWTRNRPWGLLKALTGLGSLGSLRLPAGSRPITPADHVWFHRVGDPEPTSIPLLSLTGITLG